MVFGFFFVLLQMTESAFYASYPFGFIDCQW